MNTAPENGPPTTQITSHKVGFNWKLATNLLIIAALLVAINLVWKNLKTSRAEREEKQRETIAQQAADKEKAIADARKAALARAIPKPAETPKLPDPAETAESSEQSLARLRRALASGERTEMPAGSIRKGSCDYLLVSKPLTWQEAAFFAEQHGGHLAIPSAGADLTWLVTNTAAGNNIWIGAARSGRNSWTLADGSPWQPQKQPTGIGEFLAADKYVLLRAEKANVRLPFVIQWHQNGSNPGTLKALLTATRNSLSQENPVFPPGTLSFGLRNYLFVSRPLNWHEAADLAKTAGGHLVVPSEIAETVNVANMISTAPAENGIWMGGILKGDHWLWITGEPWKTAKWAKDAITNTPDSALIIRPSNGWDAQDQSEQASGFIIEWSADAKSATPPDIQNPATPSDESSALIPKAKALITSLDAQRTKSLAENTRKFSADLDLYFRSLNSNEKLRVNPHVQSLKRLIRNNRIPSSIPQSSGIKQSQEMAKLSLYHAKKQEEIDLKFRTDAEKIRSAFVIKLQNAQSQATQTGQSKLVESIRTTLETSSQLDRWVQLLGAELQPENPKP